MMFKTGFWGERIILTLYQRPGQVQNIEPPEEGYSPDAGLTIIVGHKRGNRKSIHGKVEETCGGSANMSVAL